MNVLPRASAAMERWNKRTYEEDLLLDPPSPKRPKYYHVRLESESSITSEDDDSILTIQEQETDLVRDSSDIETRSEDSDYELFEYEVESLSESDGPLEGYLSTSSGSNGEPETVHVEIEEVVAAVLGDTSLEAWAYDSEQSSTDDKDDSNAGRQADFRTCVECKGENDVPKFRLCTACFQHYPKCWGCNLVKDNAYFLLCSSCYQVRKKFYPPRPKPRKHRTPELTSAPASSSSSSAPVNIEKLKSCLDGISKDPGFPSSQDSGLGSSQDLPHLQLDKIVIPEAAIEETKKKRRRSQDSDDLFNPKSAKVELPVCKEETPLRSNFPELKELCIVCNERPKNSAFLHGTIAHACCCYRCAIQCWKTQNKCPICNRKVKNVVKLFIA